MLLVRFALPHDFLRGEIDAAGWERIADEEVVALRGVVVGPLLHIRILGLREWQLDRLRHDLTFERRDRRFDRDGHLLRACPRRRALEALRTVLAAEFAEAILCRSAERHERMLGVEHRLHDAGVAALRRNR